MSGQGRETGGWLRAASIVVAAMAIGAATPSASADATDDADVSTLDADYAAGKQAIDARNWKEAIARLDKAQLRNPDNADLQNYLGYAHRNLGQLDAAF